MLFIGRPTTNGPVVVLDKDDNFVLGNGIVINNDGDAVTATAGGNNTLTIDGAIIGDTTLNLIASPGALLDIGATGYVAGLGPSAISVGGGTTTIENAGLVSGFNRGIWLSGTGSQVKNSGRIIANSDAVGVISSQAFTLINSGTITSYRGNSFKSNDSLSGTQSVDKVINTGTMRGNVLLGGNSDTYEGNGGRIVGVVHGEAGNDKLSGGALSDCFYGDADNDVLTGRGGRDLLSGGTGNDTFDYNSTTDSGVDALTRDIIGDFTTGTAAGNDLIDLFDIDANTTVAGNQAFALQAKGTAASPVETGKIGWYWVDNPTYDILDRTFVCINNDADTAIDMTIELVGLKTLSSAAGVDFRF